MCIAWICNKKGKIFSCLDIFILFLHIFLQMKNTMSIYIRFLSTEAFFCIGEKLLRVAEICFCNRNCLSVTEVWFFKKCCQKDTVMLWKRIFFFGGNLFLSPIFLCYNNILLWQQLFMSKNSVLGILYIISKENFLWELGVSVILDNQDYPLVDRLLKST